MSPSNFRRALVAPVVVGGLLAALLSVGGSMATAANPHPDYLVNIIGVDNGKNADMTDSQRRTIFVDLYGPSKINLVEGDFEVLDGNATKGSPAELALPDPDVDGDGILDGIYSVSVRALGTRGGSANIATCAELLDEIVDSLTGKNRKSVVDDAAYCTLDEKSVQLERNNGKPTWGDVTDELLSITLEVDIYDDQGNIIGTEETTIPLFDDRLENEFWEYSNDGLRLVQVRFTLN